MIIQFQKSVFLALFPLALIFFSSLAWSLDNEQAIMQQQLNAQVLSKPAQIASDSELTQSLSDATERGKPTKSKTQTGQYQYFHNGFYYPYWAFSRGYWY